MKHRSCFSPLAFDGTRRAPEDISRFFDRQSDEESQLDDPAEGFIQLRKSVERVVERDDLFGPRRGWQLEVFERNDRGPSSTFCGDALASVVDNQLAHDLRCQGEEVVTVPDFKGRMLGQPQVHLVYQRGRLQRAVIASTELAVSHHAQFVVHKRNQLVGRVSIASPPRGEQVRNSRHVGCHRGASPGDSTAERSVWWTLSSGGDSSPSLRKR